MKTIDREYHVVKSLGQGLSGEVYLVKKGEQLLALKLLKSAIGNLSPPGSGGAFQSRVLHPQAIVASQRRPDRRFRNRCRNRPRLFHQ